MADKPPDEEFEEFNEAVLEQINTTAEKWAAMKPAEREREQQKMLKELSLRLRPHNRSFAFRRRLRKIADNAIAEGVNTVFFILLLAGARWLVEHLFGESKFFDHVPVRYLFDVGDIAVIGDSFGIL
jgi:hypothetical protein